MISGWDGAIWAIQAHGKNFKQQKKMDHPYVKFSFLSLWYEYWNKQKKNAVSHFIFDMFSNM